jgi:2-dehydropantoate 2-reductase
MRIAIFGTGGAGAVFGAALARAGEDVVFIARGEHLRAIRKDGLRIERPTGDLVIEPAHATDDPAEAGQVDVVLLGVKAWQVREAAASMAPMIGPRTFVVPLQNGVEAADQLAGALGAAHVLSGLCGTFSWVAGPGRIRSLGDNNVIRFGERDNRPSARAESLRQTFERAGVRVEIPADMARALWNKFLLVTPFGGMGALTRAPIGVIRALPETRRMLEECLTEVETLARARNIALGASVVADTIASLDSLPEDASTSLQRDIIAGKPSELDFWNGAVVRLAGESNLACPVNQMIYGALLPQERRAREAAQAPA